MNRIRSVLVNNIKTILPNKNPNKKAVSFSTIEEAEFAWMNIYSVEGWKIDRAIRPVWSWRKFTYVLRFNLKK